MRSSYGAKNGRRNGLWLAFSAPQGSER